MSACKGKGEEEILLKITDNLYMYMIPKNSNNPKKNFPMNNSQIQYLKKMMTTLSFIVD
jgi:hypothetical protein